YRLLYSLLSVVLLFGRPAGWVFPQAKNEKHHETLRKIRGEIREVEKEIVANQKKESSVLYILNNLDLEIDLTSSVIQGVKKELREREKQIARLGKNLETTEQEVQRLKEVLSKRLVYFYKYGRLKEIELLLTAQSINQGILWLEYQKRLSEHDYRNFLKIKEKQSQIIHNRDLLTIELAEKRKLLDERLKEEKKLRGKKGERETVLSAIRNDTDLLRQQVADKKRAAEEIRNLILQLERTPAESPLPPPSTPFAQLQGRMLWPTNGKVIARFGQYRHPELKTVTENIGIDIEAGAGKPVKVVASGRVTVITWQRGRGNIVIVSHYGGYYTVYTHLEEIQVDLQEEVEMGQVIGTVGESGSLKGPMLHFEIWRGEEKLDPEEWLGKQT
ncbi:MAG TPA: peptidoglycan DD-metalloendopeptidase family protein, partial [bacterium]